jgi:hypothetical protein
MRVPLLTIIRRIGTLFNTWLKCSNNEFDMVATPSPTTPLTRKIHGDSEQTIGLYYLDLANKAIAAVTDWVMDGQFARREDIQGNVDNIPAALQRLFNGSNIGNYLLKLEGSI